MRIILRIYCENCYNIEKDKGPRLMKCEPFNEGFLYTCPKCGKQVSVCTEIKYK